jgi:hypothetical protein
MPRPKGPEKVFFKVGVTVPTHAHFIRKAGRKAVGAYVAEHLEQEAINAAKNAAAAGVGVTKANRKAIAESAAARAKCRHPINRRIGTGCGACGKDPVK